MGSTVADDPDLAASASPSTAEAEIATTLPPDAAARAIRGLLAPDRSQRFVGEIDGRSFVVRRCVDRGAQTSIAVRGDVRDAPHGSSVLVRREARRRGELEVTLSAAAVVVAYAGALASILGYVEAVAFAAVPAVLTASMVVAQRREWHVVVSALRAELPPPDRDRTRPYR